jgi:hypothetical protein
MGSDEEFVTLVFYFVESILLSEGFISPLPGVSESLEKGSVSRISSNKYLSVFASCVGC